jgi:hypothetical protein
MPDIDFPVNPSLNATYSKDGKTWIWDGSRWRTNNILSYSGGGTGYASYTTGDLLVGTGNSLIKFPVGQNNFQYLRVDSVNSASGVTWISLPLAGSGQSGLVSTLTQTFSGAKTFSSNLNVSSVTPSTSTITGALTVAGGAGIAGTLHAYALTINGTYDVILANINKNVLKRHIPFYSKLIHFGGKLLLSGFFVSDEDEIKHCAIENGFEFTFSDNRDGWSMLQFIKN